MCDAPKTARGIERRRNNLGAPLQIFSPSAVKANSCFAHDMVNRYQASAVVSELRVSSGDVPEVGRGIGVGRGAIPVRFPS